MRFNIPSTIFSVHRIFFHVSKAINHCAEKGGRWHKSTRGGEEEGRNGSRQKKEGERRRKRGGFGINQQTKKEISKEWGIRRRKKRIYASLEKVENTFSNRKGTVGGVWAAQYWNFSTSVFHRIWMNFGMRANIRTSLKWLLPFLDLPDQPNQMKTKT